MDICNKLVTDGINIRYITTFLSFYVVALNITFLNKYLYLLLPILLTVLDAIDSIFILHYNYKNKYNRCKFGYNYQISDKICDSISYLLLFLFFKLDIILLLFVVYRIIGVVLFYFTKNSSWLILFFDFAKEYLLYLFIFGNNYIYLPIFILLKIGFEYYHHTITNPNNYR
jgi:hypothetical protein